MGLPTILASSVIRSSHPGESHGGLYAVELESGDVRLVMDWSKLDISWDGRGGERGLRGIALAGGFVFVTSYDRLYELDGSFRIRREYANRYLRDCHEISADGDRLFLASTGADCVLEFDLRKRTFTRGFHFRYAGVTRLLNKAIRRSGIRRPRLVPRVVSFDPQGTDGPPLLDRLHLNTAFSRGGRLIVSGTQLGVTYEVRNGAGFRAEPIPFGTHNAQPCRTGVIANDTTRDRIAYFEGGKVRRTWRIPRYDEAELDNAHLPQDHARQAFGRGLCVLEDERIVAGSSPATISVYDWEGREPVKVVQLSRDVRNAIHGLTICPNGASA